jgi:hypothetical protein
MLSNYTRVGIFASNTFAIAHTVQLIIILMLTIIILLFVQNTLVEENVLVGPRDQAHNLTALGVPDITSTLAVILTAGFKEHLMHRS